MTKDARDFQDDLTIGSLAVRLGFCTEKQVREAAIQVVASRTAMRVPVVLQSVV